MLHSSTVKKAFLWRSILFKKLIYLCSVFLVKYLKESIISLCLKTDRMKFKFKCNGRKVTFLVLLSLILCTDSCVFEIYHEDVQLKIWDVKQNGTPSLSVYYQPVDSRLHCPCMIQFQFHGYVAIFGNNGCPNSADMFFYHPNGMSAFASARHMRGSVEVKELSKYKMCIVNGALDCGSDIVIRDDRITWQYADLTTDEQTTEKMVSITPSGYDVDNTSASTTINSETTTQQQKSYSSDNSNGTTIKPLLREINGHNERCQYTLGQVLGAAVGGAGTVGIIAFVLICSQYHRLREREESKAYETPTSSNENHYYNSLHIAPAKE